MVTSVGRSIVVLRPFRAVATQRRVVHLVTGVLRELDIQPVFAQAQYLNTVRTRSLGAFHPLFGRTSTADIQHHDCGPHRIAAGLCNSPNVAVTQLAKSDADAPNVHRHHVRVRRAHLSGELLLGGGGIVPVQIELEVRHMGYGVTLPSFAKKASANA